MDTNRDDLFAAIDEIEERQSTKRGRDDNYDDYYRDDDDEEDYPEPPEEILPEQHSEHDGDNGGGERRRRPNIVRPFGEAVGQLQEEEEEEEGEGDEEERASSREERRRRPAPNQHFDSEQEEIGLRKTRELNRHFFQTESAEGERTFDLDTEPEEHAAGMILPNVMLDDENLYFRSLFTVLYQMGKETTRLLKIKLLGHGHDSEGQTAVTELSPEDIANCRAWEKYWTAYMIEHHYTILGRILKLPIGPNGAEETITCTACLMWEIWRVKIILHHDEMERHRTWKIRDSEFLCDRLINTPGVPLDPPPIKPIAPSEKEMEKGNSDKLKQKYAAEMAVYDAALAKWKKKKLIIDTPILKLRQSQIRQLLQFITSRIRIVPYHEDMRLLLLILELKSAVFFCRSMPAGLMDEPKYRSDLRTDEARLAGLNPDSQEATERFGDPGVKFRVTRNYLVFCASYWYPIKRAAYYAEKFALMDLPAEVDRVLPPGSVERFKKWVSRMTKAQGERYMDRIEHVAKDSMLYPGDKAWHEYACINDSTNTDAILRAVRGEHAYNDYHSQLDVSYEVMLSQTGRNFTADMFVLFVFDRYLSTYKGKRFFFCVFPLSV
jgi:hypothetical protein